MGTGQDDPGEVVTRTVIPAPVTFHGMPAPRFWEIEDARSTSARCSRARPTWRSC